MNLFDFDFTKDDAYLEKFKIRKPVRLIELFAGIGAQAKALQKAKIDFEHYKVIEFDKYPLASYNAIFGTNFPTLDITKITGEDLGIVDTDKYCYIMTYSFPCQDLSLAGKQAGMSKDSGTRSGLLWEVERILKECKNLPQILLLENVPQIHNKKNIEDFEKWIDCLKKLGYDSFYQDLNAKDYGIPQNRNRTFMISILKGENTQFYYQFPEKQTLKLRLRDMLENEVDEKYYLSEKMMKYIVTEDKNWEGSKGKSLINKDIASTINTGEGSRRCDASNYVCDDLPDNFDLKKYEEIVVDAVLVGESWERMHQSLRRVYNKDGICPTLDTMQGGYRQPKIFVKEATKKGYAEAEEGDSVTLGYPNSTTRRGRVGKQVAQTLKTSGNDIGVVVPLKRGEGKEENPVRENHGQVTGITTLWTETQAKMINEDGNVKRYINSDIIDNFNEGQVADISFPNGYNKGPRVHNECPALNTTTTQSSFITKTQNLRIRKLTPKECWRLMGFDDEDFDKATKINSNTQLYKQAGNSIVVNVLTAIFKEML